MNNDSQYNKYNIKVIFTIFITNAPIIPRNSTTQIKLVTQQEKTGFQNCVVSVFEIIGCQVTSKMKKRFQQ